MLRITTFDEIQSGVELVVSRQNRPMLLFPVNRKVRNVSNPNYL